MLQVGGCSISDVYDLAKHAERIRVDYVLCLPELYFKPKTEADLVNYFKEVAACCPSRPIYYYHIPRMTGVDCELKYSFFRLFYTKIPNLIFSLA